jgi:superfamily II DNA/RNA helicase
VIGVAETGSGKTLTYALPILHHLKTLENDNDPITVEGQPRAVVVVPSRELGEQIAKVFKPFTHTTRLRVRTVLGGTTMEVARRSVAGAFEVLVATPGRLLQFTEKRLVNLSDVRMFVFDEADQMVDQGFMTDAIRIVSLCPRSRQMALFSATVSPTVQSLMTQLFKDATLVRSSGSQKTVDTLTTHNCKVINGKREPLLDEVLAMNNKGGTLVFVNTREQCDQLFEIMQAKKQKCAIYRGEMDKLERRRNLKAFREGAIDYLISTDLAGRGLDVEHVGRVINYHLPKGMDNYLHRVGRTARAGREGLVINFVTERDADLMAHLEESGSGKKRRR